MIFFVNALAKVLTGGSLKAKETGGQVGFKPEYNLKQQNKKAVEAIKELPRKVSQKKVVAMEKAASRRTQEAVLLQKYAQAVMKKDKADVKEYGTRAQFQEHKMDMAAQFAAIDAKYIRAANESRFTHQVIEAQLSGYQQACDGATRLIEIG